MMFLGLSNHNGSLLAAAAIAAVALSAVMATQAVAHERGRSHHNHSHVYFHDDQPGYDRRHGRPYAHRRDPRLVLHFDLSPPPVVVHRTPPVIYGAPAYYGPPAYESRGRSYGDAGYASAPSSSSYCREFIRQANIGGRLQDVYGTACLQPDGSWRIMP
jgi:opacity protein-like surface antigen